MAFGHRLKFSMLCLSHRNFCGIQHACHGRIAVDQIMQHSRVYGNMEFLCVRHVVQDLNVYHIPHNANIPDANRIPVIVFSPLKYKIIPDKRKKIILLCGNSSSEKFRMKTYQIDRNSPKYTGFEHLWHCHIIEQKFREDYNDKFIAYFFPFIRLISIILSK